MPSPWGKSSPLSLHHTPLLPLLSTRTWLVKMGPPFEVLTFGFGVAQGLHEHLVGEVAHALGDAEHASLDVVDVEPVRRPFWWRRQ